MGSFVLWGKWGLHKRNIAFFFSIIGFFLLMMEWHNDNRCTRPPSPHCLSSCPTWPVSLCRTMKQGLCCKITGWINKSHSLIPNSFLASLHFAIGGNKCIEFQKVFVTQASISYTIFSSQKLNNAFLIGWRSDHFHRCTRNNYFRNNLTEWSMQKKCWKKKCISWYKETMD